MNKRFDIVDFYENKWTKGILVYRLMFARFGDLL